MSTTNLVPLDLSDSDLKRFWSKVTLPDENGCMLWTGYRTTRGYGSFGLRGTSVRAHRVSLQLAVGPHPVDKPQAAHAPEICHRPSCVAPAHLRWATRFENAADRVADGTDPRGENHGLARLTEKQVLAIVSRWNAGERNLKTLASEFGVSRPAVHHVVTGSNWAWLTGIGRQDAL